MRCAVLGSPIAHSLSPVLHAAAYAELGLVDWSYEAVEVTAQDLPDFLAALDETWRGLSLTMPLKRVVVPLLARADRWVEASGVANTVVREGGLLLGANPDIPGATAALRERGLAEVDRAVVLGGGATATSVLLALADLGCTSARLLVRDPSRAEETVAAVGGHPAGLRLEVGLLAEAGDAEGDVLVSTVPVAAQTPSLVAALAAAPAVFDVVYDSWPTPLARAAQEAGTPLVSGLDLLAHQAALQVELMTGRSVDVGVLRTAGAAALERRGGQNPSGGTTIA